MTAHSPKAKAAPRRAVRDYARTAYTEAILDAAERLFLRVGYHDAKMADLAAEAGVAVGTLYNYFESKEEVFASLAGRGQQRMFVILDGCLSAKDPVARLGALLTGLFGYIEDHGALLTIYMQLGLVGEMQIRSAGGESAVQAFDKFLTLLESVLRDGVKERAIRKDLPVSMLAASFAGMINAASYAWVRSGRSYSLVDRAGQVLGLFLEGARVE